MNTDSLPPEARSAIAVSEMIHNATTKSLTSGDPTLDELCRLTEPYRVLDVYRSASKDGMRQWQIARRYPDDYNAARIIAQGNREECIEGVLLWMDGVARGMELWRENLEAAEDELSDAPIRTAQMFPPIDWEGMNR